MSGVGKKGAGNWLRSFRVAVSKASSLRWKLFLSYLLICFIPLLFFSNAVARSLEGFFVSDAVKELKRYGNIIASKSASVGAFDKIVSVSGNVSESAVSVAASLRADLRTRCAEWGLSRVMVLSADGFVVADSDSELEGSLFAAPEVGMALRGKSKYVMDVDKARIYAVVPALGEHADESAGAAAGAVVVSADVNGINYMMKQVNDKRGLIVVLLSVVVFLFVFFISRMIIEPLQAILSVMRRIADGGAYQKVEVTGNDEVAELASAFNDMSGRLEAIEAGRQEFVSNVSHELKTPITSMKLLSDALLSEPNADMFMYREFLVDISGEVNRMALIINDLLTLVRIDRSENALNANRVIISEMVDALLRRLRPLAKEKNIDVAYAETRQFALVADEAKLFLVFSNLIENAIKYTPDGGKVLVTADGDHQNVFVTVKDTGIGIAEGEQERIFDRFYRVDKTRSRETGGTGLGLAIAYKIVLLHDGSIKVFSKEGEGSSFVVRLPVSRE